MAKMFETADDIQELAYDKFEDTGLAQMGINLKVMSVTKAKTPLKVSRANATIERLIKNEDVIILYVYEEAFDRLNDDFKAKLMEGAMSNIFYDNEKDKLNVETNPVKEILRMRKKYNDYVDVVETSTLLIDEILEEENRRKAEEREAKKNKKKN